MNKTTIIQSVFACASLFVVTSCADTDAQYTVADGTVPTFVSVTPDQSGVLAAGEQTFTVTYDCNVFFASANASQITINGTAATSAAVYGSSNTLTITGNVPSAETITLNIPAGIVYGPQQTPTTADLTLQWKGRTIEVATAPVNANATTEAKSLYQLLYDNYGARTLSATMANTNWNTENAEALYATYGKYPAIAGFDYIHTPYSGESWIDYDDLSPVTDWAAKGGKTAIMWHWLVPTHPIWAGNYSMPGDWSGSIQLTDDNTRSILANAKSGDMIVVHYKNASGAQGSIKNSSWTGVTDGSGNSYDYFDIGSDYATFGNCVSTGACYKLTLDDTSAKDVKDGIVVSGHDHDVTSVSFVPSGEEEMTYRPDETTFNPANLFTEGSVENETMKADIDAIGDRLLALQDNGIAVLWRPLHEAAGNTEKYTGGTAWFWWGYAGADIYKQLWQYMFNTFQTKGVNNLIWVWTGDTDDSNWYPGDDYVDIIGADIYDVSDAATIAAQYSGMQELYSTKMITLSECGAIANYSDIFSAGATWSWFMPWPGDYSDGVPQASESWWNDAINSGSVLFLDDIQ